MRSASARRRRPTTPVDLPAHQRDGLLVDACRIPRLDGGEIRLARLVTGSRTPAIGFQEVRRRAQRVGGNLEVAANALNSTANFLKAHGWRAGAGYQPGEPNFAAIQAWNAAGVYQKAIALMGRQIDGGE